MEHIVKVETEQLEVIVKQSGLEKIEEGEDIKKSYLPFLMNLAEIQEQAKKINFDNPVGIDETIAKELRLKTVKIRTGAMDVKEGRKKVYLLKGNLEQAAYNIIAASCKLTEEAFVTVEKAREIAQKKKEDELRVVRTLETAKYSEFMFSAIDLGKMSEEEYGKLLSGAKLQYQAKIDAEAKAEQERIAKEKAEKEEQEKIELENTRLKEEAIQAARLAEIERLEQAKELAKQKAKADAEAKKAKDIADKKLAAEKEKAAADKKIADEKLKAEQEKAEALAAELKAKADAEAKAQDKIRADKKAKEQEEKQAAKLSDSKKLEEWINSIRPSYEIQGSLSKEGELLFQDISKKLLAFRTWSIDQLTKLK